MKKNIFIIVLLVVVLVAVSVYVYGNLQKTVSVDDGIIDITTNNNAGTDEYVNDGSLIEADKIQNKKDTVDNNEPNIKSINVEKNEGPVTWLKHLEELQASEFTFLEDLSKGKGVYNGEYENGEYEKLGVDNKNGGDIILFTAWPKDEFSKTYKVIQFLFLKTPTKIKLLTKNFPKAKLIAHGDNNATIEGVFKINSFNDAVVVDKDISYQELDFPEEVILTGGTVLKRSSYFGRSYTTADDIIKHNIGNYTKTPVVIRRQKPSSQYDEEPIVPSAASVGIEGPANTFVSYIGYDIPVPKNINTERVIKKSGKMYINAGENCHAMTHLLFANSKYVRDVDLKKFDNSEDKYTFVDPDNKIVVYFYDYAKRYAKDDIVRMRGGNGGEIEVESAKDWIDKGGIFLEKDEFGMYIINVNILPFYGGC